ncbi:MAG: PD40 domain-containing protein [Rhodocyclaceae bacterium]|nr:PD40 domain-containing protein [Rhodocyclaceae bacterium]MBX3668867.1 PD40 domain-containing protein [Rhodocyclaceae bacterium]
MSAPAAPQIVRPDNEIWPYPGLRAFYPDEEYLFFGREAQVDSMVDKLAATHFLAVVGTSGSGKSSLVNCGLRPALYRGLMAGAGSQWRIAQFRPGSAPIAALAGALAEAGVLYAEFDAGPFSLSELIETTLRMSALGLCDARDEAQLPAGCNLLVVADQFEELFRYRRLGAVRTRSDQAAAEEAVAFVNLLLAAAARPETRIYVVITMRSDFLGDCAQFTGLPEAINRGQYLVPRLTRDELRRAITGPAAVAGGEVSAPLATRLINDVGDDPDQLPILQHALKRTWERRLHGGGVGALQLEHYEATGGMALALNQHAEETYAELPGDDDRNVCARLFKALTDKSTDTRGIRRPTRLADLCAIVEAEPAAVAAVIDRFREPGRSFLLPPAKVPLAADTVIDISHESLMRVWQRLRAWGDDECESTRLFQRLAETSRLHAEGRASLWRDPDLRLARDWQRRQQPSPAWARQYATELQPALDFLQASHVAAQAAAEAERQSQEHARQLDAERRRTRRLRSAATFSVLATLIIVGVFFVLWRRAEVAGDIALSRQLAAQAENELSGHRFDTALLLALEANHVKPTFEARDTLMHALQLAPDAYLWGMQGAAATVAFSPDGKLIAAAGADGRVLLWDAETRKPVGQPLAGHARRVASIAFSPDGKLLASAGADANVILWEVASGKLQAKLAVHRGAVLRVAFSPDGKLLASAGDDGTILLWDLAARAPQGPPMSAHRDGVTALAFDADSSLLASASYDGTVRLWNLHDRGDQPVTLASYADPIWAIALSPDGRTLAVGAPDEKIEFFDLASRKAEVSIAAAVHGDVNNLEYSPDGRLLAAAGSDHLVNLFDTGTGKPAHAPLAGHQGRPSALAWRPDARKLATVDDLGGVMLWDVRAPTALAERVARAPAVVMQSVFSADGGELAAAGYAAGAELLLWQLGQPGPPQALAGAHDDALLGVAYSPDGSLVATLGRDRVLQLWDRATRRALPGARMELAGEAREFAFSADGKRIAVASYGTGVQIVDVAARKLETALALTPGEQAFSVAYSPDGKWLAAGSGGGKLNVWHADSLQPVENALDTGKGPIYKLAFSANSALLAAASRHSGTVLWQVSNWVRAGEPLNAKQGAVFGLAFDQLGQRLASAGEDGTLVLWNVAERHRYREPVLKSAHAVLSVQFSPDGRRLAAASWGDGLMLWNADVTEWEKAACRIANRDLSRTEWTEFAGAGEPYRRICASADH